MKPHSQHIQTLQFGRAIAALMVVLSHAELAANSFTTGNTTRLFGWGSYGVDFFFVLSGFIIFYVHGKDRRSLESARLYIIKRLSRIYLPYIPVSLAIVILYNVLPELSNSNRTWSLVTSLTLFPTALPPALSVAWTLVYEMVFYAIFLTFFFTRKFWFVIACWAVCVLGGSYLEYIPGSAVLTHLLNPIVLEFILGMLAARVIHIVSSSAALPLALMAVVGFILFGVVVSQGVNVHRAFLGVPLACLVLSSVCLERDGFFEFNYDWVLFLGSASYAIYLVHNPVTSVVARVLVNTDSWLLTFITTAAAGVVIGSVYHLVWEKPVLRKVSEFTLSISRTGSK